MSRSTPPSEGRALLLTLVGSVALAGVCLLAAYDPSEAAPGAGSTLDRTTLLHHAVLALPATAPDLRSRRSLLVRRDTDTTGLGPLDFLDDVLLADSSLADSLVEGDSVRADSLATLADTTEALPDTGFAARLLPPFRRDRYSASLAPRRRRALGAGLGTYWQRRVELDSVSSDYTITERVGEGDVRVPVRLGLDAYREQRLRLGLEDNYRDLVSQRARQQQRRSGLGFDFDIPGGRNSAFAGIFGTNEVDLRVNGQANVDVGFAYRQNEQQEAATGQGGRVDPDFGQELGLGITGTIGDKLQINVNYDTQNDFDFQNQVKLTYTGYEDEILQRVEAGNVFLQTPSDLIRGGQRLFGIRTDLQVGGLGVTVVASQQDAESDELTIEGGSQTTTFTKRPTEYEDNANFYLGYYFHNRWDAAHANPPNVSLGPSGFSQLIDLEVFLFEQNNLSNSGNDDPIVRGIALLDLGEPAGVLAGGQAYLAAEGETPSLPDSTADRYSPADLDLLRTPTSQNPDLDVADLFGLENADFFDSSFRRLRDGQDYTWDPLLGSLSLKRSLSNNEAVAVAYRYQRDDGTVVEVGDFGEGTGGDIDDPRIVLKLLRGPNPRPDNASWDLTMRNIYRVGGSAFNAADFQLQVLYAPPGATPQRTLPGVDVGQPPRTLLQTLGLDRVNQDGARTTDDLFDFLQGYTVDSGNGRIIFPYRQPFGEHLERVLRGQFQEVGPAVPVAFQGLSADEAVEEFVFSELYEETQAEADRVTDKNVYNISGEFRGSVQEIYDLGFSPVENSVQVRSGGIELVEGSDYTVDYITGTVTITNPAFLTSGRDVSISFERNQFVAIQKKTLLGLRADYTFNDRFGIGATWMRLSEKPLIDKFRLGEEPIANSIWGFDAAYAAEPRWMTRLVDALPLIQTRAPSSFEFKGEFAQLNPGHPETFAFEQSRDDLRDLGRDFKEDEQNGSISYIDDFEGTENSFSLLQPGSWRLAAAPEGIEEAPGAGPLGAETYLSDLPGQESITSPFLRTSWRGRFAWYTVLAATYENDNLAPLAGSQATSRVFIKEVFEDRELQPGSPPNLPTLDLYLDPAERGPYNYNAALGTTFADNPQDVWGGMTQRLPEGFTDFDARNNIEFVEFIFSPFGGRNGESDIASTAKLYVDLGQTSEDVIPNRQYNNEDGLLSVTNEDAWGRPSGGQQDGIININDETQRTEDLGLDGLPSQIAAQAAADNGTPYNVSTEAEKFAPFLDTLALTAGSGSSALALAQFDPSADDYHSFQEDGFFNNGTFFPGGATLQERFSFLFPGLELNSLEAQRQISESGAPGNSRFPDSEDLNLNLSLDQAERFFRYEIPLDPGLVDRPCMEGQTENCNPFYVTTIFNENQSENPAGREWYLIRIPVRSDQKAAVGGIEDFSLIETIRLWTQGHEEAATLRFATLDLVGSQWLKSEQIGPQEGPDDDLEDGEAGLPNENFENIPTSFIATINTEENPDQYEVPNGAVQSFSRDPTSGRTIPQREQALALRVDDLGDGQERAIFKPYTNRLDLTKYSNLRTFVHGEGFEREDSVRVFLRLGSNETQDYYEIEQPVYPFDTDDLAAIGENDEVQRADSLWQTNVRVQTANGTEFIDLNSINVEFDALNKLKLERDQAVDANNNPVSLDSVYTAQSIPLDFAPPGAIIRIRGNPSIKDVSNIVLGVRNGRDRFARPVNVELWYNELRVSGFDEQPGWSAYARTTVRLADFVDLNARYDQQTDGFGDLSSGLGTRTFEDSWGYSVTTNLNVHKFIPERYGWRIPVNLSVQRDVSTPRFSPSRGDITVAQEIAQIEESNALTPEEKDREIREIRAAAETVGTSRVIRVPISKTGSRSPWLRYTLDGLSLTYSNTLRQQRTPAQQFNDTDQWNGTVAYRLAVPRPKTVRPFWFLGELPVVGVLGGLRLNVLPQSLRLSADASRSVNANQDRPRRGSFNTITDSLDRAARIAVERERPDFIYPIREQHTFNHRRNFELGYNPFQFLQLQYRSDVRQSLNSAGADETFATLIQDYRGGDVNNFRVLNLSQAEVLDQEFGGATTPPDSVSIFPVTRLDVVPATQVFGDLLTGERSILTDDYNQTTSATVQSPIERVEALSWLQIRPLTYTGTFSWRFTPLPGVDPRQRADTVTVASVANQTSLQSGLSIRFGELFEKIGPYRRLRESQEEAQQNRQTRRQDFERDLQAYRTARDRVERAEEDLREAEDAILAEADSVALDSASVAAGEDRLAALRESLADAQAAADTLARPSPPLPIPNPVDLLRRGFLGLTGPRDFTLTYNGSFSGSSQGVRDPGYSFLDGLTGDGPGIGYRLGFDRRIGAGEQDRFFGDEFSTIQVQDELRDDHRLGARTSLEFSQALRVDLTWDLGLNTQRTFAFSRESIGTPTVTERGNGSATILSLGGTYNDFFDLHRERYSAAINTDTIAGVNVSGDLLTQNAVVEDFRSAFVTGLGSIGRGGFNVLPLPNWTVNYTGIANFPIVRALTQSATLQHGYSATYDVGFLSNPQEGTLNEERLSLTNADGITNTVRFISETPFLEANSVRVSKRFQPLVGLNLGFKGGFQTDLRWSSSESYALTPASAEVNQTQTREFSLRVSFNKTGLRIPLPFLNRRRLNNNFRFSLIASQANNLTRRFELRSDLEQDISNLRTPTFRNPLGEVTTRLSLEPSITYTLSNQVRVTAFVRYNQFDSEGSRNPSTSTLDGGFTFNVSFSN
ncbi:MAG: cell surface protein SprA [Bacteroidota bacterium]